MNKSTFTWYMKLGKYSRPTGRQAHNHEYFFYNLYSDDLDIYYNFTFSIKSVIFPLVIQRTFFSSFSIAIYRTQSTLNCNVVQRNSQTIRLKMLEKVALDCTIIRARILAFIFQIKKTSFSHTFSIIFYKYKTLQFLT